MQALVRHFWIVVELSADVEAVAISVDVGGVSVGSHSRRKQLGAASEEARAPMLRSPRGPQLWLPYPGWERDVLMAPHGLDL
jgi:hypothetical protein